MCMVYALATLSQSGVRGFTPSVVPVQTRKMDSKVRLQMASADSDIPKKVALVGPGLLQLVIAKACMAKGIEPLLICPTKNMESFRSLIVSGKNVNSDKDAEYIMDKALFGFPEESDPVGFGWREGIDAVIFCAEEGVIGADVLDIVMSWDGYGSDRSVAQEGPKKAILCAPLTNKVTKEKSMGWIPIFNNDKNEAKIWTDFIKAWFNNPFVNRAKGSCQATTIRFGSLLGGGVDGPSQLETLGLNERAYKMSLEQYRDLRERSFDRYRLGVQVLLGDDINPKPKVQEQLEKKMKGEEREAFVISGEYPQSDRTNRHTLAQAVVQTLVRPAEGDGAVPKEFTVLSKSISGLPSQEEWDEVFKNPGPASWPDPADFVMPMVE